MCLPHDRLLQELCGDRLSNEGGRGGQLGGRFSDPMKDDGDLD